MGVAVFSCGVYPELPNIVIIHTMPFAATLCLAVLRKPDIDSHVTLQRTGNVAALLRDLSSRTGVPLSVTDRPGKEILIVALKDAPLNEAMKQIAWATYTRWEKSGEGYRLMRDPGAEQAAGRHYEQWQSKEAATAIANFRNRILTKGLSPNMPRWQREQMGRRQGDAPSAAERALATALGEVRPETLVSANSPEGSVYSNQPTAAQLPFTQGGTQILSLYNSRSDLYQQATRVILECKYQFEVGSATIRFFSAEGTPIGQATANFGLYDDSTAKRPKELFEEIDPALEVPLSEASRSFVRPNVRLYDWPSSESLAQIPDIVEKVRNPERYEPLATFATDVWLAVGAWKKRNVVANIDDAFIDPSWAIHPPKLADAFRLAGGYNAELQTDWIVARPTLPVPFWRHRMDRAALGRLARAKMSDSMDAFLATAEFASAAGPTADPFTTTQYLTWAGVARPLDLQSWPAARLYGLLPRNMQRNLMEERPLSVPEMPVAARRLLRQMTYPYYGEGSEYQEQPTVRDPRGAPEEGWLMAKYNDAEEYVMKLTLPSGEQQVELLDGAGASRYIRNLEKKDRSLLSRLLVQQQSTANMVWHAWVPPDKDTKFLLQISMRGDMPTGFIPWDRISPETQRRIAGR